MIATLPQSVPVVCNTGIVAGEKAKAKDAPPDLLIEIPHGATKLLHFESVRGLLRDSYDEDLIKFFYVNTDIGAPEAAVAMTRKLVALDPTRRVRILRSLVPRTFIDCNRAPQQGADKKAKVTAQLPDYIQDSRDIDTLRAYHDAYTEQAERAYAEVCESGGLAITLHTYAPRSVEITDLTHDIVSQLEAAWQPEQAKKWKRRPPVDLITTTDDGEDLSPAELVNAVKSRYQQCGIDAAENATYKLHSGTMGYRWAKRYAGQVLCVEFDRERLVEEWLPLQPMTVDRDAVDNFVDPLVQALDEKLRA